MRPLLLSLHYYDESGVVKPPVWLYVCLVLACADWFLFIFSLASFSQTSQLLELFYPDRSSLLTRLVSTIPLLIVMLILGNRSRLWKRGYLSWRQWVTPLILVGLIAGLTMQVITLSAGSWQFHWYPAFFLLFHIAFLVTVLRSQHLKMMTRDWGQPETSLSR